MTTTTEAKERLAADFRAVMTDIDALLASTTTMAESEATALRARIIERLDAAKVRVAGTQQQAAEQVKRAADATDHYVHDHPWQAIGAAAAVGLALGVLIGRR